MAKWYDSDTLIASIKRKGMLPNTNSTFTDADFLALANEEMDIGVLPHILQYHEDYLMQIDYLPISPNRSYYEIPSRSVGNKIRMVNYVDPSGNVYDMTRVLIEDLPYYQNGGFGLSSGIRAFFIENDEIVMLPIGKHNLQGALQVSYYLTPNELVPTANVSTITGFNRYTGVLNVNAVPANIASAIPMDFLQTFSPHKRLNLDITPTSVSVTSKTFTFGVAPITQIQCTAKASIPSGSYITLNAVDSDLQNNTGTQRNDVVHASALSQNNIVWLDLTGSDAAPIGTFTSVTRVNLATAVTATDVASAISAAINTAALLYFSASALSGVLTVNTTLIGVYSNISVNGALWAPIITNYPSDPIPEELVIGDYVAQANQCIIPNIPTELHSMLAQRVVCRCMEALGDMQGLQMANQKLAEMELKTGSLIDNRCEGAALKVVNRHGFLRQSRRMLRR